MFVEPDVSRIIPREARMSHRTRLLSAALLIPGLLLVFLGVSAAMGFTPAGVAASAAAIAALLYAGAVWGVRVPQPRPSTPPLIVFDRNRRVVTGPGTGEPIELQFASFLRPEVERRCAAALEGVAARFVLLQNGRPAVYDAVPVRGADDAVLFGVLLITVPASDTTSSAR